MSNLPAWRNGRPQATEMNEVQIVRRHFRDDFAPAWQGVTRSMSRRLTRHGACADRREAPGDVPGEDGGERKHRNGAHGRFVP
jgi:hypothetical protein